MTKRTRHEEYLICQDRGHTPGDTILTCNPPLSVCAKCGTHYRSEVIFHESNIPKPRKEDDCLVCGGTGFIPYDDIGRVYPCSDCH